MTNTIQWVFDTLNNYITQDQLVYYGALLTIIVGIITFYKENLREYVNNSIKWFKTISYNITHIKDLQKKIDNVEENLLAHRKFTESIILPNFESIKKSIGDNKIVYDESLEYITKKISFIEKELTSNSGKSIKDLIDKIAVGVSSVEILSSSLEHQVKKIEARQWNIMINNLDTPMFETDAKGLCIRANKVYLELVGMQLDDVINNGWVNIIYLEDRKLVQQEWESAIDDKRMFDLKYKIQNNHSNKYYQVRCISQPVFVDTEIVGYIGRFLSIVEVVQDQKTNIWTPK